MLDEAATKINAAIENAAQEYSSGDLYWPGEGHEFRLNLLKEAIALIKKDILISIADGLTEDSKEKGLDDT